MSHGRVEVFTDDNRRAVIARFTCKKASTEEDKQLSIFTHLVCRHLCDADGNWGQLTQGALEEIQAAKASIEGILKDEIQLTDVEYIEL